MQWKQSNITLYHFGPITSSEYDAFLTAFVRGMQVSPDFVREIYVAS
jgi:hypothetical protein